MSDTELAPLEFPEVNPEHLYTYRLTIRGNYDGDTLRGDIDLGFGHIWEGPKRKGVSLRLYGLNTAELHQGTPEEKARGLAAQQFVQSLLPVGTEVVFRSLKDEFEKFGRALAVVRLPDGRILNQLLLEQGFAVRFMAVAEPSKRRTRVRDGLDLGPEYQAPGWDVIVTCHADYVHYLPEVLSRWEEESQTSGGRRCLVLDTVTKDEVQNMDLSKWEVVAGNWGHPALARNAGLDATGSSWVFFWDADNEVPPGVGGEATELVNKAGLWDAYFGPHIEEAADPRDTFMVDTNALWRREAIDLAGRWQPTRLEDWSLGLRIWSQGWSLRKSPCFYERRFHARQRGRQMSVQDAQWSCREIAIVTLQRDKKRFLAWWAAFVAQEKPDSKLVQLIIVCDGDQALRRSILGKTQLYPSAGVVVLDSQNGTALPSPSTYKRDLYLARCWRVTQLFFSAEAQIRRGTPLVLTWEDDVFPSDPKALRKLSDAFGTDRKIGAVAGYYACRGVEGKANTFRGLSAEDGYQPYSLEELTAQGGAVVDTARVGAGFTLWARSVLEDVHGSWTSRMVPGKGQAPRQGWDFTACATAISKGYSVKTHTGVFCDHVLAE